VTNSVERRKEDRRVAVNRLDDKIREQSQNERIRKLHSLLELGELIGLELKLDEMLLKIAQKACDVIQSDRCSLFLYDQNTNELWSKVALGMSGRVIRMPSDAGLAGACFRTGETINLEDAYTDPRFAKIVDEQTGYRTRSLLCAPVYNRDGLILGVIQLLTKKDGMFLKEDETFLKTFANHASIFIEIAQLQKARIDALEQSRKELELLNKVKSKAIDHLSHELKTPLAVIRGNIHLLKRKLSTDAPIDAGKFFETLEKNLDRILDIQQETDDIVRSYRDPEGISPLGELDRMGDKPVDTAAMPPVIKAHWNALQEWHTQELSGRPPSGEPLPLYPFVEKTLEKIRDKTAKRTMRFQLEGPRDESVFIDPRIVEDILESLLKNAVENTPDEGMIRILVERQEQRLLLKVQDFGIGITEENQRYIFDGLFHTQETDLYTSKKPYDFNAGGKGLDLLRMKVYGQRFRFDLAMESRRCRYIPTDRDLCPGRISDCSHCRGTEDCLSSGGSTFSVSFPLGAVTYPEAVSGNEKNYGT
jgi:signal transduction histidine kinase